MAFRIAKERTFKTTAHFVDGQSAGVTFRVVTDDELERAEADGLSAMLRATVADIEIEDENGQPTPFTPEIFDQVIASAADKLSLSRAYNEAVTGAKLGN